MSYALTPLKVRKIRPTHQATLIQEHWHIKNRLHYARDFTFDGAGCRVWSAHSPA